VTVPWFKVHCRRSSTNSVTRRSQMRNQVLLVPALFLFSQAQIEADELDNIVIFAEAIGFTLVRAVGT